MTAVFDDAMLYISTFLVMANMAAGAVIMSVSICRVNSMGSQTDNLMRLTFVVMSAGGFSLVVAPLFGSGAPAWPQTISHIGIAILFLAERRRAGGCCPKRNVS